MWFRVLRCNHRESLPMIATCPSNADSLMHYRDKEINGLHHRVKTQPFSRWYPKTIINCLMITKNLVKPYFSAFLLVIMTSAEWTSFSLKQNGIFNVSSCKIPNLKRVSTSKQFHLFAPSNQTRYSCTGKQQ